MSFKLSKLLKKRIYDRVVKKETLDVEKKAQNLKRLMINEFNSHPVTLEIKAGPNAENYSGTLVGASKGNLFSFIGFEENSDPVAPILQLLESIKIKSSTEYENSFLTITLPKIEDFWEATPMPWQEGRSWAKGIESGISGLNYYLFSKDKQFDNSRSGTAVQASKIRSRARYVPTQYMTTLLKKYKTKFSSLYKRNKNIFTFIE